MESPPSSITWSEAFILSDDSGLLLTSGSVSSGSMSGDSRSGHGHIVSELQDSDCDDKSFSQADSLDGMSDIICGENFNTLKKGPHWTDDCKNSFPIDPPPEFQDKPNVTLFKIFADKVALKILNDALSVFYQVKHIKLIPRPVHHVVGRTFWTSDFLSFSPCHLVRPGSQNSLGSSRLSSSHNSLSVPTAHKADDSSFIMQAVSHDTLTSNQISDLYNVPFDSDVYAVPVDVVKPPLKPKYTQLHKRKRRNTASGFRELERHNQSKQVVKIESDSGKRHSVAGTSSCKDAEPIHMTLQEVRQYLQTLYSSSSDSSDYKDRDHMRRGSTNRFNSNLIITANNNINTNLSPKYKRNTFFINIKNKKVKDPCEVIKKEPHKQEKRRKQSTRIFSLKRTLCNIFRFGRFMSPEHVRNDKKKDTVEDKILMMDREEHKSITTRALPPLPPGKSLEGHPLDFATSIQKVKDYGWYWGPLSSEAAEKILSNEPDGSFIVRDSSDDHYIFSLTFKLNNSVRHVRIDHDQGNFSFGSRTKFKSQTIVEFIENAVEHSRSGRYLFFLHRRPLIGPIRVQLLHPVSRFKQIQSLQHMCRFVILKVVRRDLIPKLQLPRRLIDYLSTAHYYSEQLVEVEEFDENLVSGNNVMEIMENLEQENLGDNSVNQSVEDNQNIINTGDNYSFFHNVPVNIFRRTPSAFVNDLRQS